MNHRFHRLPFLLAVLLTLLQGCGQKGPLYLPDDPQHRDERSSLDKPAA